MNKSLEAYLVHLDMPLAFRLRAFYERYCSADDEAYLHLAAHAAFPIAMTPDLLYKIWLNFREDGQGNELKIPYLAVSDLLLSSLYRASGRNTFEMPDGIRLVLLDYLQEDPRFGEERKDELAYFLRAYLQENPQAIPSEAFRRAQEFIVKLRLEQQVAAEELLKAYNQARHVGQVQHLLNMAEGELNGQEVTEDGQKNPLVVATEFVRGVQEYKRGNKEKGLELLERLKGRLSNGANGGIRVNLEQRILEALPKEMNLGEDERPVFLGVFYSLVSSTRTFEEKYRIIRALESVKELNSIALVDKNWKELNTLSESFKERVLIFHFAGFNKNVQLSISDVFVDPNQLADFLAQFPNLKLVFLNSMRSERFIEKLVERGIPVVLATYGDITDSQAISFAHNFYEQLALNTGLSDAYTFAKSKPWSLETNSGFIDFRGFQPKQTTYYLYHKSEHDEQWKLIDAIQLFLEQQRATKQAKKEDKVFPGQLNKIPFLDDSNECIGREKELKEMRNRLYHQAEPVFLVGNEGVGKTTLLRAFISQYYHEFNHTIWLDLEGSIEQSVVKDKDLMKLIEGQPDKGKRFKHFRKLASLLITIPGPNLLIIDSEKNNLPVKEIINLLPSGNNWKVIISSRTNKGFNPIVINPLNNDAALVLFNNHYQDGKDPEKSSLLKLLEYIPDRIIQVTKFLNQFKGFLSIQSLLIAAEKQKFNINKVAEFLSKSKNDAPLGIKIKNWLELNGEKEVIQDAVLKHLDSDAEGQEINRVLVAWLNTNGAPSFIFESVQRYLDQYANEQASGIVLFFWVEKAGSIKDVEVYLKRHLEQHADKKETCNLMIYWLMYGGEPQAIRTLVKKHLDVNYQNESSLKLISIWLGASGDIELVKDNVIKALNKNLGAEQIVLIVSAWLEAGGELDVVQESVQLFMQLGPMELFTSSIIQSWLKAGGGTTMVENGMIRYLDKYSTNKEAGFLMVAWLEAGGSPHIISHAIAEFTRVNKNDEHAKILKNLVVVEKGAAETLNDSVERIRKEIGRNSIPVAFDLLENELKKARFESQLQKLTLLRTDYTSFSHKLILGTATSADEARIREIIYQILVLTNELHSSENKKEDLLPNTSIPNPLVNSRSEGIIEMIRIAIITVSPKETYALRINEEIKAITYSVKVIDPACKLSFAEPYTQLSAQLADLISLLISSRPQLIHFIGDGSANGNFILQPQNGNSQELSPEQLLRLLKMVHERSPLIGVVFNIAHSHNLMERVATMFDYVIGWKGELSDRKGKIFAESFYESLAHQACKSGALDFSVAFEMGKVVLDVMMGESEGEVFLSGRKILDQ